MGIDIYLPRNDVAFREMLQSLVSKNNLKFTVFIEKPSKPFNEWTFPKVCELYGLSDNPNHSIDVYPIFRVGVWTRRVISIKWLCENFFDELETRIATTPSIYPMRPQKVSIPILILPQQLTHLRIK
uniref:Uncharacterized protein n=1 Tax=Rhizophagus irregularis (strain DAOM 181602 / DAOM 197198 / MUCL 43194) TaxID=747089 RepID=U9UFE9_RHIID